VDASVRLADGSDLDAVCASLALAFEDDPVWEYMLPDPRSRIKRLSRIFRTMMKLQHLPR